MPSLAKAAECIGVGPAFSVVHDFFGFWGKGPRPLSLRTQLERLQGNHVHLNFIRAGLLRDSDRTYLDQGLQGARNILSTAGIGIGRVGHFAIIGDELFDARFELIVDENLRDDLAEGWSVQNDGIDVFVAHEVLGTNVGVSPIPGSCDKSGTDSGLLVGASDREYGLGLGQTIAHELGHFFGLRHRRESNNLMYPNGDANGTQLFSWQKSEMRQHCSMRGGCAI